LLKGGIKEPTKLIFFHLPAFFCCDCGASCYNALRNQPRPFNQTPGRTKSLQMVADVLQKHDAQKAFFRVLLHVGLDGSNVPAQA